MSGYRYVDELPLTIYSIEYSEVEKRFAEVWRRLANKRSVGVTTFTPTFHGPVSLGGVVRLVLKAKLHWRRFLRPWVSMFNLTQRNLVVERVLTGGQERVKCSKADLKKGRGRLEWDPESGSFKHFKYV